MRCKASARSATLSAIRKSLGVSGSEKSRGAAVQKRITKHARNLVPERAQKNAKERLTLFVEMLEGQSAQVSRLKSVDDIPRTVATYLREHNLPAEFRCGEDAFLASAPWDKTPSLTRMTGAGQASDAVAISHAVSAAAETGTMFLTSGPDNPTTLNFLPDTHIAVIRAEDILGSYEDAWDRLRVIHGKRAMPRTVNLISGASRTADIEQTIVMGAHGPRRLHVIIVE